ncbi:hypothetical protein M8J75_002837 [Diaphorina citri]|nr:hypothetical protein M8J75_002837 [Diaphorina citri]
MSGSAMCNWGFTKNHLQRAFDLGKLLGCEAKTKEELLTFLMKASPKEFAGNQDKVINDVEHLTGTDQAFVPTVDGEFLTEEPLQSLRKGNVHDLPTIVGTVSHEGFLIYNSVAKWPWFVEKLNKELEAVSPYPIAPSKELSKSIRNVYFQGDETICFKKHNEQFVQLFSHTHFLVPMFMSLKYELNSPSRKAPIYCYRFAYDGNLGWFKKLMASSRKIDIPAGVSHVDELGYLLSNDLVDHKKLATEDDRKIVDKFTTLWSNFAKTGNPNPTDHQVWSPIESYEQRNYLDIASPSSIVMKKNLDKDKIDFWLNKL